MSKSNLEDLGDINELFPLWVQELANSCKPEELEHLKKVLDNELKTIPIRAFVVVVLESAKDFLQWYETQSKLEPENFPMELEDAEWWDQYDFYIWFKRGGGEPK